MKQIYRKHLHIMNEKGEWIVPFTLAPDKIVYKEPETTEVIQITYPTFLEFWNAMQRINGWGVQKKFTTFRKKPYIAIGFYEEWKINEKNFNPITIRWSYESAENLSLWELMHAMPAEKFLEYCMDRGINSVNISK